VEKAVDPFLGSYSFSVPFDTGSRKAWVSAGAESDVLSVCLLVKEARCSGEGEVPGKMIRLFFLFWTIEEDRKCRFESDFEAVLGKLEGPGSGFPRMLFKRDERRRRNLRSLLPRRLVCASPKAKRLILVRPAILVRKKD